MSCGIAPSPEKPVDRASALPLRAGPSLSPDAFYEIRRRTLLEGCKWDPQVGDTPTLAPFPLWLRGEDWLRLSRFAEQLTAETFAAERELAEAPPELLKQLGLPSAVRRGLQQDTPLTPAAARVVRFDFHFTTDGWRISEANTDVPGGYSEASFFTGAMAEFIPGAKTPGDPASVLAHALEASADGQPIALVAAPGYMEDQQVVAYLAGVLRSRGCHVHVATASQVHWREQRAYLLSGGSLLELGALFRFYQAEWLPSLPARCDWRKYFRGGLTPVCNPGLAITTESKRFPLIWDQLSVRPRLWSSLLPETRDPRDAPWRSDSGWLLKSALCNTGDAVCIRESMEPARWKSIARSVRWFPSRWIAQRRFTTVEIDTPLGPMFPCIGVFTINGHVAGAYARLSRNLVTDFSALDVALLIEDAPL